MVSYPLAHAVFDAGMAAELAEAVREAQAHRGSTFDVALSQIVEKVLQQRAVEAYGRRACGIAVRDGIARLSALMVEKFISDTEATLMQFYDGDGADSFRAEMKGSGNAKPLSERGRLRS